MPADFGASGAAHPFSDGGFSTSKCGAHRVISAFHEPAPKSGDESPHSKRFAAPDVPWSGAKRLECVRFSGAFWFMVTEQVRKEQVPFHEPSQERGLQSAGTRAAVGASLRAEARAPQRFTAIAHGLGAKGTFQASFVALPALATAFALWLSPALPAAERPPAPVLITAAQRDLAFRVEGRLQALPDTSYGVLVIVADACPGATQEPTFELLDRIDIVTDSAGQAAFSRGFDLRLHDRQRLVARTMDLTGDSSEFSNCLPVRIEMSYWSDVAITVSGATNVARPAEPFTFVMSVENRSEQPLGNPPLPGVEARFFLPEGARFVGASGDGVLDAELGLVRFPDLTVPAEGLLERRVTVEPRLATPALKARATVEDAGPYQVNNEAVVEVAVDQSGVSQADLSLQIAAHPEAVRTGAELVYTLTVRNQGPDDAAGVVVSNRLPPSARLLRASSSQGTCTVSNDTVRCDLARLTNGAVSTVTLAVQPISEEVGALTNVATVVLSATNGPTASDGESPSTPDAMLTNDPDPTNNTRTNVVLVLPPLPLDPIGIPVFDPQTGLFKQEIRFTNIKAARIPGLRLWFDDIAPEVLVLNRSGTAESRDYVDWDHGIEPAETVSITAEFYRADRQSVPAPHYEAAENDGTVTGPPPPPGNPPLVLSGARQTNGFALSWQAVPGRTYVVQGRDAVFQPWWTAGPAFTASSSSGQWTETASAATNLVANLRFFRVLELP